MITVDPPHLFHRTCRDACWWAEVGQDAWAAALRPELHAIFEEELPKHEAALRWLAER